MSGTFMPGWSDHYCHCLLQHIHMERLHGTRLCSQNVTIDNLYRCWRSMPFNSKHKMQLGNRIRRNSLDFWRPIYYSEYTKKCECYTRTQQTLIPHETQCVQTEKKSVVCYKQQYRLSFLSTDKKATKKTKSYLKFHCDSDCVCYVLHIAFMGVFSVVVVAIDAAILFWSLSSVVFICWRKKKLIKSRRCDSKRLFLLKYTKLYTINTNFLTPLEIVTFVVCIYALCLRAMCVYLCLCPMLCVVHCCSIFWAWGRAVIHLLEQIGESMQGMAKRVRFYESVRFMR